VARLRPAPLLLAGAAWWAVAGASASAAPPARCPGAPIAATRTFTGSFSTARQGAYVMLPFRVPRGVTQVRVRYCWDRPEAGTASHTLDLGVYDALRGGDELWGAREFRGWGGSSHPDVALSPQGFSPPRVYRADPRGYVPGRTTRGFEPGLIRPGRWAVELGVAAVIPRREGDATGEVGWRVDVQLSRRKAFAAHPYRPARYRRAPARRTGGWYAGDFHVHDEHSNLGAATIAETLGYAFRPAARGGAGLDFTALSDYVTDTAWGEIGRYQARYPGKLIIPSAEVITYRGHGANQNAGGWVDYRTGPILERHADGALTRLRGPVAPRRVLGAVHRRGGFSVINHPRTFAPGSSACRGCYWDYSDAATDFRRVDAIELFNSVRALGPETPNPFDAPAVAYWQHALATGAHVAALGGSDTHQAGRPDGTFSSPLGRPATMVFADELSADGVQRAVQAGHTYVKSSGVDGPDLRLSARAPGSGVAPAIMGDSINRGRVRITARALNASGGLDRTLELQRDGRTVRRVAFRARTASLALRTARRGRYGLVLRRGPFVEAISSPVYVGEPTLPLTVQPVGRLRRHGRTLVAGCRGGGTDARSCAVFVRRGGRLLAHGRAPLTGGRARVAVRLRRGTAAGAAVIRLQVIDREGSTVSRPQRVRLP
jgi:hypothetical protein